MCVCVCRYVCLRSIINTNLQQYVQQIVYSTTHKQSLTAAAAAATIYAVYNIIMFSSGRKSFRN